MANKSFLKNISLIIAIVVFLAVSLPNKADAEYGFVYLSPEGIAIALTIIAITGFAIVAGPNLIPAPVSVATGETFVMRAYPPIHPWVEFGFSTSFATGEIKSNLLSREYYVRAPMRRGIYDYERKILGVPFGYKISALSETESRAGVVNPTRANFDRSPVIGALLQSLGFIFGFGYIYADEIPMDNSWPWQGLKSSILGGISYGLYDNGAKAGLKNSENPGFYFGLGTIALTTWDVVRIINAKNEYAKEMRENGASLK